MQPDALLGVAFGEVHEPAGVVLCMRHEALGAEFDKERELWPVTVSYTVQRVARLERAGRYGAVVDLVAEVASKDALLLADITACGSPPIDLMIERRLKPVPVIIGEAVGARAARRTLHLSRRELVAGLSIALAERRLKVAPGLEGAEALARQLERVRTAKPAGTAAMVAALREDERDELVRALALAVWWGENRIGLRTKQPPVPRQPIEPEKPLTFDMALKLSKRGRRVVRTRV